jgi:hypothetical protein
VWVRRAAIRPVPRWAEVPEHVLDGLEAELADDEDSARESLDEAFTRFEQTQPALAERVARVLQRTSDETALALGYFLTITVWLAFERWFEDRLDEVSSEQIEACEQALALDEELRRLDPAEAVDSDDVVAMEQPHLLGFVNGHLDAALEANAGTIEVDEVGAVFRLVLVEVLSLSYAVRPPEHYVLPKSEFSA